MLRRLRFLLLLLVPAVLILFMPSASTQVDGQAACAEALAAANGGATTWNGYKIVRAPQRGGSGADVVLGTSGNDDLRGGSGRDLLCGFGGNDTLWGGSNDDVLVGGPGADSLYGESGDDVLYQDAQDRVVNGGSGRNEIILVTVLIPTATPITPTVEIPEPTVTPITPTVEIPEPTATPITPTVEIPEPTATPITPTVEIPEPTATPITPTSVPQPSVSIIFVAEAGGCRVYVGWANFPPADALDIGIYSGDGTRIGGGITGYVPGSTLYSNNVLPNGGPGTVYAEVSPPLTASSPVVPSC